MITQNNTILFTGGTIGIGMSLAIRFKETGTKPDAVMANVSSGLGFVALASVPVYSATKAAIHSCTTSLRYQLRSTFLKVVELFLRPSGRISLVLTISVNHSMSLQTPS